MKTGTKIFLLIGILLLALGLTILQIANHRGISFNAGLVRVPGIHTVSDLNYDQKGYTVLTDGEESFPAGEVRALKLDWNAGSVDVERYNGSTVLVREEAKRALKENECLRYKLSGGELSILPCANRVSNMPEKHLTVFIPQGLVLESLAVDVSSADVKVSGVETEKTILLESGSGALHAEDCRCAELSLESSSGEQRVLRTARSGANPAPAPSGLKPSSAPKPISKRPAASRALTACAATDSNSPPPAARSAARRLSAALSKAKAPPARSP